MVMPCSRSAARPSTSRAKSSSPPWVPTFLRVGLEGREVVLEDELGVVEQPADEGALAVVDAAAGDEAQHRLVLVLVEVGVDVVGEEVVRDVGHQKYPSCFFFSMDPRRVVVDDPALALGAGGQQHLLDDLGERRRLALDRAGERVAARGCGSARERSATSPGSTRHAVVVDHDQRAVALDHRARRREVQRHDRDLLEVDVLPHVELGPVRQREHPHALPRPGAGVVEPPQLGPLRLRVPPVLGRADREHPLLGPRLLLVAAGTAEGQVEPVLVERLLEPLGLPDVGVRRRPVVEGVDAPRHALGVLVHEQLHADLGGHPVAELVHRLELPGRVDVQQRERRHRRVERLAPPGAA